MKQISAWFLLSCKRQLKRPVFVLILLALPLCCLFIHGREKTESQSVNIAVCSLGADDEKQRQALENALVDALSSRQAEDPLLRFYVCQDEDEVKAEVASRRAECGYAFGENLRRKFDEGKANRSITVYRSPATILDRLSDEVVFAELAQLYDREIFVDYIVEREIVSRILTEEAGDYYDKWLSNDSTFRFEYRYRSKNGDRVMGDTVSASSAVFPVRGLVASCMFLMGIYSAMILESDEKKGLFLRLLPGEQVACKAAVCMAPVVLTALSGLAALWAGGCAGNWGRELIGMILYVPAVCIYGLILKMILPKPQIIGVLIPFFLIATLLFCPVFVDVGTFHPYLGLPGRFLLPWYYLRAF